MIRVVVVSASAVPGGAERALQGLVRNLPDNIEPMVVLLQDGDLAVRLREAGCTVLVFEAGRTRQLDRTLDTVLKLRKLVRRLNADVVLSSQSKSHVYGGLTAALARIPAVWWQLGVPRRSRIETIAGAVPAAAVVCCSAAAEEAQRRLTPHRRVVRIPLGVDVHALTGRRGDGMLVRDALGWTDEPIVGIVGRLQASKGQETFIRAAAAFANDRPEVRFLVVGGAVLGWEGSYADDLRTLAAELGVTSRMHFAGHQHDVAPWLDACDVVVSASHSESFGLVLVEAMALGKPLVVTDSGGPRDIVENETSGLLVPPADAPALARSIKRVLSDPRLAARLAAGAKLRAHSFDERRMAEQFSRLLWDVAGHSSHAASKRWAIKGQSNSEQ